MHNSTGIKICGITDTSETAVLNDLKIDYVGFVFAKSIRQITPDKALSLIKLLSPSIVKVGVFTKVDAVFINRLFDNGIIDIAQIHTGDFAELDKIRAAVWVSVSIEEYSVTSVPEGLESAVGIHFDTYDKKLSGGTGRTFDWSLIKDLKTKKKLILSGGLNHINVKAALSKVEADVVDVSSGVEIVINGKRIKNRDLIRKFVEEVKSYDRER